MRIASVWPSDEMSCLHAATLHVVFLASFSRWWFGHVFSHADFCHFCDSDIRLRTMFTEDEYIFQNTGLKYPYLKHENIELWIMHGRHGSHAWYLNIVLNRHTCMITSFLDKSIFVFKLKLMVTCYYLIYQGFLKFLLCA